MSWHRGEWVRENRADHRMVSELAFGDLQGPGCTPGTAVMPHPPPKQQDGVDPDTSVLGVRGGRVGW